MATLPDFSALGERPVPRPAQAQSVGVAPRSNLGDELSSAGRQVQSIAEVIDQANARQDEMNARDAANKLKEHAMLLEYDPKDGLKSVSGEGVTKPEYLTSYQQRFTDKADALAAGLSNDRQRQMFARLSSVEGLQFKSALLTHQASETKRFNDATDNSTASNAVAKIARDPANDLTFAVNLREAEDATKRFAQRNGLGAEQTESALSAIRGSAYVARIQALMHGIPGVVEADPDAAQALFKQALPVLGEKAIEGLSKQLETVGLATKAQQEGAAYASRFDYTQTTEFQKALDARTDLTPIQKKAIRDEVEHRHAVAQSDANVQQAQTVSKVMEMAYSGMSTAQILRTPEYAGLRDKGSVLKHLQDKAYTDVLRATANDQRAIAALQRHETELHIKQSAAAYRYLDPQVIADTPRAQLEMLLPVLGRDWTSQILARKDSFEKKPVADAKVDHDDMMSIMGEMGLKPFEKNKSEDGKAMIAMTQSRVERALTVLQQQAGKPLDRETKNALMREEIAKSVTVDRTLLWNVTKPIAELTPQEVSNVIVPPQEIGLIRREMKDLFTRSGGRLTQFEDTPENVVRYYLQYRKGSITAPMIPRVPNAK